ncbi:hypothetical protein BT93_L4556 [Corymbia citriodora subsp. variegata]|uniref:EamA domain-containing protein n=1 Tax=Corymbia citriodora subsp. variegata TaxID=360336 RepID=A0A8T0CYE8_CORYI|nr:hypothetical protein BT93_L4556 [Corymbia citriodora subsp. variegata]
MATFDVMSFLAMVIVQVGFAGMSFISKLAMDDGINPSVLVTYRQIIATIATAPVALLLERYTIQITERLHSDDLQRKWLLYGEGKGLACMRKMLFFLFLFYMTASCIAFLVMMVTQSGSLQLGFIRDACFFVHKNYHVMKTRPKITVPILVYIFLSSLTGNQKGKKDFLGIESSTKLCRAFMNQFFFLIGLNNSSPTVAGAMTNTLPAVTFLFALLFKQESFNIKTKAGRAKVIGTFLCVGGAMLLSFYHGHIIAGSNSGIHWNYAEKMTNKRSTYKSHSILGPFLLFCSVCSAALWFIIQAKLSVKFPAPYTSTTLMCLMASIQCLIVGVATECNIIAWSLRSRIRLIAVFYVGIVCSALAFSIMSWCVHRKGPLYTSVFSPLMFVMLTLLSWALLREKLYVGTLVGAVFIIVGLYSVLWGKGKEAEQARITNEMEAASKHCEKGDLELQLHSHMNDESRQDPN